MSEVVVSAHPDAFARLAESMLRTKDTKIRDVLLDKWSAYRDLATDWDAEQWGFDPERWMAKERLELSRRGVLGSSLRSVRRLGRGVA